MKITITLFLSLGCWLTCLLVSAQNKNGFVTGQVLESGQTVAGVVAALEKTKYQTTTDSQGKYTLQAPAGDYTLVIFMTGFHSIKQNIEIRKGQTLTFTHNLQELSGQTQTVIIEDMPDTSGRSFAHAVEGFNIFESKKNEVIRLSDITANMAANNARQVLAQVPGLHIWESDAAGLQLNISARGLDPSRTANFNVRQNGYDISADPLGYPESYYTPPMQAVEKISLVRGAASLQFGPQFGGMLDFKMKQGPKDKKAQIQLAQTVGSYGFLNTFGSVGGTIKKTSYYSFLQYKQGGSIQPNADFRQGTGYMAIIHQLSARLQLSAELTWSYYNAQQPGGLTDAIFERTPYASIRERNWFRINWQMAVLRATYQFSDRTKITAFVHGLHASRQALGMLERPRQADVGQPRSLIKGEYQNLSSEVRLMHKYRIGKRPAVFLTGTKLFAGRTVQQQGQANDKSGPDFFFTNPDTLTSDYIFPGRNVAWFVENIFNITPKWSLTPGFRAEFIDTRSDGYFSTEIRNLNEQVIARSITNEEMSLPRSFVLLGLGSSFRPAENVEIYSNVSENYRSVTFSDLRLANPNFLLDSTITDEKGFNADIGVRGKANNWLLFDVSAYVMEYNNRIGIIRGADTSTGIEYQLRTNVGDSRHYGTELYAEVNLHELLYKAKSNVKAAVYSSFGYTYATYVRSKTTAILGRKVELVPAILWRSGLSLSYKKWKARLQYAYTSRQFTDATNAERSPSAIVGVVPAYQVTDFSVSWQRKWLTLEGTVNNVFGAVYFTRRASGYPGPGIIPAAPRLFYVDGRRGFLKIFLFVLIISIEIILQ